PAAAGVPALHPSAAGPDPRPAGPGRVGRGPRGRPGSEGTPGRGAVPGAGPGPRALGQAEGSLAVAGPLVRSFGRSSGGGPLAEGPTDVAGLLSGLVHGSRQTA